jgi:hypothetical protein
MTAPSTTALALRVVNAERAANAAESKLKAARAQLLERMAVESAERLEVPGGVITFCPAGTSYPIDAKACGERVIAFAARLRALGERDVNDEIPTREQARAASLRVTLR